MLLRTGSPVLKSDQPSVYSHNRKQASKSFQDPRELSAVTTHLVLFPFHFTFYFSLLYHQIITFITSTRECIIRPMKQHLDRGDLKRKTSSLFKTHWTHLN